MPASSSSSRAPSVSFSHHPSFLSFCEQGIAIDSRSSEPPWTPAADSELPVAKSRAPASLRPASSQPCSFPERALPSSSRARHHPFASDGSAKPPVQDLVSLLLLRRPASRAMEARASSQFLLVLAPPPSRASSALPQSIQASPGPFPRRIQGFPLAPICWLTSSASRVDRAPPASPSASKASSSRPKPDPAQWPMVSRPQRLPCSAPVPVSARICFFTDLRFCLLSRDCSFL